MTPVVALSSPTTTVRAATSLGTGSLAGVIENNTNNSSIMSIVIDTPPILDKTTIGALVVPTNKKYRMVAFDLDGTLLNSSHKLSNETKTYVRYLAMERGFTIVFATGRAISTVYEHILDLNLPHNISIPVVSSNGACAFDCRVVIVENNDGQDGARVDAKPLFATPVPEAVARKTIQLARKYGHCSQYYIGDEILADPIITPQQHQQQQDTTTTTTSTSTTSYRSHLQLTQLYKDLTGAQTVYLPHDDSFEHVCIDKGLPSKQLVLFPPLLQDEMMVVFEREMKHNDLIAAASTVTLEYSNDNDSDAAAAPLKSAATVVRGNLGWFLEILHPTVCKGNGLQRLVREHFSSSSSSSNMNDDNSSNKSCMDMDKSIIISMDDCIAFGDGDNDVEFLQMAGLGIVMLNGRKVAKQAADCITTRCNDMNGVVETLQLLEEYGKLHFPKTPSPSIKSQHKSPLASLSTASLSSSLSSSNSVTAAALQVDNSITSSSRSKDTLEDSSCNDTVEF